MNTSLQRQLVCAFWQQFFYKDYVMHVGTSTIGGIAVIEGAPHADGIIPGMVVRESVQPCLSPEDEDELLAAMAEIERGEFALAADVLESLRKYG
jgi:hypothetical protein